MDTTMDKMTKHEFYTLAKAQGQVRWRTETFEEFEKRVMTLKEKRDKHHEPWRADNTNTIKARQGEKR